MIFLALAILSSTVNHLLFKTFTRLKIDLLTVIVVNYGVCIIIGTLSSSIKFSTDSPFVQAWLPFAIIQGLIFIGCLFILGKTTATQGVSVATLATRLSVVVPVVAAFFLYNDVMTLYKCLGILATLLSLTLSSGTLNEDESSGKYFRFLPVALFIVFGLHSTLLKFVQDRFLDASSYHAYLVTAFASAFLIGAVVLGLRYFRARNTISPANLMCGLSLGCTNYGSIYFLIKALGHPGWQSSVIFPTVSIAVVLFSSIGAWILFHERFRGRLIGALTLGIISIILLNLI